MRPSPHNDVWRDVRFRTVPKICIKKQGRLDFLSARAWIMEELFKPKGRSALEKLMGFRHGIPSPTCTEFRRAPATSLRSIVRRIPNTKGDTAIGMNCAAFFVLCAAVHVHPPHTALYRYAQLLSRRIDSAPQLRVMRSELIAISMSKQLTKKPTKQVLSRSARSVFGSENLHTEFPPKWPNIICSKTTKGSKRAKIDRFIVGKRHNSPVHWKKKAFWQND